MQEQLDIERERFNDLLRTITDKEEDEYDDDSEMKITKPSRSWNSQKLRLVEKAKREYAERIKDAKKEQGIGNS